MIPMHRNDSAYPTLAQGAVDYAYSLLTSPNAKDTFDGSCFNGVFILLEQMKANSPFTPFPVRSDRYEHPFRFREEDKYKYREPVWQVVDDAIASFSLPEEVIGSTRAERVEFVQDAIHTCIFVAEMKKMFASFDTAVQERSSKLVKGRRLAVLYYSVTDCDPVTGISARGFLKEVIWKIKEGLKPLGNQGPESSF